VRRRTLAAAALLTAVATALAGCSSHHADKPDHPAATPDSATALRKVEASRASPAAQIKGGPGQRYPFLNAVTDPDGSVHVRFTRTYQGLPVLGGDFVVHASRDGVIRAVSLTLNSIVSLATRPTVTAQQAADVAGPLAPKHATLGTPRLVVEASGTPTLAWEVVATGDERQGPPSDFHVLVDARSKAVLDSWDTVEPETGTGMYSGPVTVQSTTVGDTVQLRDRTRGGTWTVDMNHWVFGKGQPVKARNGRFTDPVAVDAQYGAAMTWDFYLKTFHRKGIANDGKGAESRIHYGSKYDNAYWDDRCFCMTYGDGDGRQFKPFPALDVTGHEMTHGVTSHTAALRYSGESGGLNEATSDVLGTMVRFYAANKKSPGSFQLGASITVDGKPFRYMDDPARDGHSAGCWSPTVGRLNVHFSSGVGNHLFYLLANGSGKSKWGNSPTCGHAQVKGIGRDKAARIWYRALSAYWTSNTNYHAARVDMLSATADLYGKGSREYKAVNAAWAGVNVT
jgi:Zn-dependent metalloprotease